MSRLNIGSIFTKEGISKLTKGQVLGFQEEGKDDLTYYEIVRIKPAQQKVIVEKKILYKPEEIYVENKRGKTKS